MKIDTKCCICNRLDEDGSHLFLKCKGVRAVWRELNLEAIRCLLAEATSARDMMERILKVEGKNQLIVICLLWIWWGRGTEEGRKDAAGLRLK